MRIIHESSNEVFFFDIPQDVVQKEWNILEDYKRKTFVQRVIAGKKAYNHAKDFFRRFDPIDVMMHSTATNINIPLDSEDRTITYDYLDRNGKLHRDCRIIIDQTTYSMNTTKVAVIFGFEEDSIVTSILLPIDYEKDKPENIVVRALQPHIA